MARTRSIRKSIYLLLAISLVAAACSSSGDADENSSPTADPQETGSGTVPDAETDTEQDTQDMCRTLDLLSFAGVTAGPASQSLTRTDLVELSPAATAQYGNLLVSAPREACQEHIPFADEIAYWLGF